MKTEKLLRQLIIELLDGFGEKNLGKDAPSGNLRYDVPVRQRGGNVLDDEQKEADMDAQSTQQAACCLIMADDGKVLAVSRKNNPSDFGLPGGKVDDGEDPETAAARELQEETGLTAVKLAKVFVRRDPDGFTTTTFACEARGKITTPEAGVVRWVAPEVLFQGSFGEYNKALFGKLGL